MRIGWVGVLSHKKEIWDRKKTGFRKVASGFLINNKAIKWQTDKNLIANGMIVAKTKNGKPFRSGKLAVSRKMLKWDWLYLPKGGLRIKV